METLYPDSDLYRYADLLTGVERAEILRLRAVLAEHLPSEVLADHWDRAAFPADAVEPLAAGGFIEPEALGGSPVRWLFQGFRSFELARHDASVATWYNGQASLFLTNIEVGGSPEQVARWRPSVVDFSARGVFAMTEPDHGSDVAGGLETTVRRSGGDWVLDGTKRWIGSAAYADHLCVVAREPDRGPVRILVVPADADGVRLTTIERKTSVRMVTNSVIELDSVRVPDELRLANVESFADVGAMLRRMRMTVAWHAAGVQAGAFEAARRYARAREQFGRPIGGFQLVQDKLARMLGNLTSTLGIVVRLSQRQDEGVFDEVESSLAKRETCRHMRETVALAREVCGGNGITLDSDVARFHADAEAIYTYEGTDDINALVVGRAITGLSAFTR
ncbi:acyl-CoA dehydrogenase family protein [Georgenia sp. Z1344]|uniref:acyl-CoA dehydrogenase family protein n=1 Tax=Georgenia sp. Z1344 TaxID=3416706 RepID=UPI003CFA4AAB